MKFSWTREVIWTNADYQLRSVLIGELRDSGIKARILVFPEEKGHVVMVEVEQVSRDNKKSKVNIEEVLSSSTELQAQWYGLEITSKMLLRAELLEESIKQVHPRCQHLFTDFNPMKSKRCNGPGMMTDGTYVYCLAHTPQFARQISPEKEEEITRSESLEKQKALLSSMKW